MTLTLVPRVAAPVPRPRFGPWVTISVSLMLGGVVALASAVVIGLHWFYGMHQLVPADHSLAVTVPVGDQYVVDQLVANNGDSSLVDVRSVRARLGVNTAGATVQVRTCTGTAQVTTCQDPDAVSPGTIDLTAERIVVIVHPSHAGTVKVDGVEISYRSGVRSATQHVGPTVTITAR